MKDFVTAEEMAEYLECPVLGDKNKKIFGISLYEESNDNTITYIPSDRIDKIKEIKAGVILTRASIGLPLHRTYIITKHDPYIMLSKTIQYLIDNKIYYNQSFDEPKISDRCQIGRFVTVGNGSVIEEDTIISDGVVIGDNVIIGKGSFIRANTVIGNDTVIGMNTEIGACCNIGTENFEYCQESKQWIKIPAVGCVVVGNNVRIGGNVVVEKGTIGTTMIGNDTQIENLVQIGHEVEIGHNCHIVACVAIAGWAKIGHHVTIYGQSAVSNRVKVGDNTVLLARSGVDKNIIDNQVVSGYPAQDHHHELRFQAFLRKLFKLNMK